VITRIIPDTIIAVSISSTSIVIPYRLRGLEVGIKGFVKDCISIVCGHKGKDYKHESALLQEIAGS